METFVENIPTQLSIRRDPYWVNVPREVGDGMEALPSHTISSTSIDSTVRKNDVYSISSTASAAASRCSSPQTTYVNIENDPSLYSVAYPCSSSPSVNQSLITFTDSEKFLIEEKTALKNHLEIQIQVNQEIKKLLVASVGDEVSYHYDRLSTEKAQMAKEIDEMKSQLAAKKEEKERTEISCDVWRSKFLASRVQCDEAVEWRRIHERQSRELESAVRGMLGEQRRNQEHLQHAVTALLHLEKSLSSGSDVSAVPYDANLNDAEKCRKLANSLANNLLESSPPSCDVVYVPSPAEKHILQIYNNTPSTSSMCDLREAVSKTSSEYQMSRSVQSRLHTYTSNITLNCCSRCKGDIKVV